MFESLSVPPPTRVQPAAVDRHPLVARRPPIGGAFDALLEALRREHERQVGLLSSGHNSGGFSRNSTPFDEHAAAVLLASEAAAAKPVDVAEVWSALPEEGKEPPELPPRGAPASQEPGRAAASSSVSAARMAAEARMTGFQESRSSSTVHETTTMRSRSGTFASEVTAGETTREISGTPKRGRSRRQRSSVMAILASSVRPKKSNVRQFVEGPLSFVGSIFIALSIVLIFVQLQYEGWKQSVKLGLASEDAWPDMDGELLVCEHLFTAFFLIELITRVVVLAKQFFVSPDGIEYLNLFDMFLVLATCFDLYIVQTAGRVGSRDHGVNFSVLRPFRFLRIVRTLRVLTSIKLFVQLRVLVFTVAASFMALFWSVVLLGIVMLMTALILVQALSSAFDDPSLSLETKLWIQQMYGDSARSFYTVFELTFSGGWPAYVRPLVEEVSSVYAFFFVFYIVAVTFAMFRIITALFLKDTLAVASRDAELAVEEKLRQRDKLAQKLLEFFDAADVSQDGRLTFDEFSKMLDDQRVIAWLSLMEVDIGETAQFFKTLAGREGCLSAQEFVQGILRMKGGARGTDVMAILHNTQRHSEQLQKLSRQLRQLQAAESRQPAGLPPSTPPLRMPPPTASVANSCANEKPSAAL